MTMTAEEFLEYVDQAKYSRDKGKARLNRAAGHYRQYVAAYTAESRARLVKLCLLQRGHWNAIHKAAEDVDAGRPMVQVPGLLQGEVPT